MNKDSVAIRPMEDDSVPVTVDMLKAVMPKRQKANITQDLVDTLNDVTLDPEIRMQFKENFLGYTKVLEDPTTTLPGYLSAVKYISYTLMGCSNQESWIKTFPDRYQRLIDNEADASYIRSIISAYNRGKVVNLVRNQSMIPTYILNQDVYQKAINIQAELMVTAKSEKVRSDAANSLLTHLKVPEAMKVKLDIDVKEDESVKELRAAMLELVGEQRRAIASGANSARSIAEGKIIDGSSRRLEHV